MRISSDPQDPGFPKFRDEWMVWTVLLNDKPISENWCVFTADEEEGLVRYWDPDDVAHRLGDWRLSSEVRGRVRILSEPRPDPDPRAVSEEVAR
jgi:hypothetical protein